MYGHSAEKINFSDWRSALLRNVHLYIALPMHSLKLCTVDGLSPAQMAYLRGCSHEWVRFIWT